MFRTEFESAEVDTFEGIANIDFLSQLNTSTSTTPHSTSTFSYATHMIPSDVTPLHSQIPHTIHHGNQSFANLPILPSTQPITILCCMCGAPMQANPSRMCIDCLSSEVDITAGISKSIVIPNCKDCKRLLFHRWVHYEPESRELLTFCLKKIRGLNNVRLTNANFIWTEPHSKRIRIKLTIQKEVMNNAIIQHAFIVNFIIQSAQCDECKRLWTPHVWNARVQLRQRTNHKRTFYYLEQIILKQDAHENVINIVDQPDGLDFQFVNRNHAQKFVDFVASVFPIKTKLSKELISHDSNSNSYYHKYTFYSELPPICKDDLVWLTPKVASLYGGISPLLLCYHLTTSIYLVDPFTLQYLDIISEKFWKNPFESILVRSNLSQFIILNFEYLDMKTTSKQNNTYKQLTGEKYKVAYCEVARANDFGYNDETSSAVCYLGNTLNIGDWWMGYDFTRLNFSGHNEKAGDYAENLPCEIILTKRANKIQHQKSQKPWKLHWLTKENETNTNVNLEKAEKDMEDFQNELEESAELRKNIILIRDPSFDYNRYIQENQTDNNNEDIFKLEELMDSLTLNTDSINTNQEYDEENL